MHHTETNGSWLSFAAGLAFIAAGIGGYWLYTRLDKDKALRQELLHQVNRYTSGLSNLQDFRQWTITHLRDFMESANGRTAEIARDIDEWLVEIRDGNMSEAELRASLRTRLGVSGSSFWGMSHTGTPTL